MKKIIPFVVLICFFLKANAQNISPKKFYLDTINVKGRILNIDGTAIPNLYIKTTSQDTILQNDVIYAKADSLGYFAINGIKPNDIFTINTGSEEFKVINQGSRFITITLNTFKNVKLDTTTLTVTAKRSEKRKKVKYIVSDYLVCAFPTFNIPASYPFGKKAFYDFIHKHLIYPDQAIKKNIEGKVVIKFTINKGGCLINPTILNGIGYGCDAEAIRAVGLSPRWAPQITNGKPVVSDVIVEVLFKLEDQN
ncbi:energy transducer TonB [Pedobacter sp. UBA5917]|jgi:TonB family protein|uniref:energy transducer TonB n=1 Tax=Pedobacter sp. UBA5917 TaxID=1947061 RepID=UPI0025DD7275|nr:energy transducer TonB [Pedobacter sp. UBA5917]